MPKPRATNLPALQPLVLSGLNPVTLSLDTNENMRLQAHERLQQCHLEMLELMAGTPSVRTSIRWYLEQWLDLNSDQVGLHFFPTDTAPRARFSLTEAAGFFLARPNASTEALRAGEVVNLADNHRSAAWSAPRLLEAVKALDLKQAVQNGWNAYWMGRAPGTAVSRRVRAAQLYKSHFEASAHFAQSSHVQRADSLQVLHTLIEPHTAEGNGQRLYTEQLLLNRPHGQALPLPGAWVVTRDSDEPVNQLLYLPFHEPSWQVFTQRTGLERWLLDHQQTLFQHTAPSATIGYQLHAEPLVAGINQWLTAQAEAQLRSTQVKGMTSDVIEGSISALLHADAQDLQRQHKVLFAAPPVLPQALSLDNTDQTPIFGLLSADLPASERQAMVNQELQAIERWLGDDYDGATQHPGLVLLKQHVDRLRTHQEAAATAAWGMLNRRVFDLSSLNTHYTALYHARLGGLRSEAQIQHTLGQLTSAEHALVEAILNQPTATQRALNAVAVTLSLSLTQSPNADNTQVSTTQITGPLLITTAEALAAPETSSHSVLLYWPGAGGALQRYRSRQVMEQSLLHLHPEDSAVAVHYTVVSGDPFDHGLQHQQTTFEERAASLRATYAAPSEAKQQAQALENLRLSTFDALLVPAAEAREAALMQVIEQNNSSHLAKHLPTWLQQTTQASTTVNPLIKAYTLALLQAQALIERSLPPREQYLKLQIDARLRKDFALRFGFRVQLQLPDSVEQRREPTGGAAPGTSVKLVYVASDQTSTLSLETLALGNIDSTVRLRLGFMRLVIQADDPDELATLKAGITQMYLTRLVSDLNLAQKYEQLILDAFRGNDQESLFATQYRRECLLRPWRLTLQLQGEYARLQAHIDAKALRLLTIAIDADSRDGWNVDNQHVRLLPAHLTAGGADTQGASPVTLSGITFIEEQNSGHTLLYLPESADGRFFRPYASLELARKALFNLCQLDTMARYVASRALIGSVAGHMSRLLQAQQRGFDGMIGVGFAWPLTTSLAAHQRDAHLGRLIQSHRNDSRSNEDLLLEHYAQQSDMLFMGIKIALGFVPVIGTAVNLADGVMSLQGAVDALRRGQTYQGVEQLAAVFESVVYALLDIAPALAAPHVSGRAARQLTRLRQVSRPLRQQPFWNSLPRHDTTAVRLRFEGYDYEHPISLADLQPQANGIYRQVYRHAQGDFIVHQGRVYQVEFDKHLHTLRLSGTRRKTYKQPIGLNERDQWDTHGGLYGTLVDGGLAGGGNVLGHVANQLEPLWPAAIREWLPRWWTDRVWREQQQLITSVQAGERALAANSVQLNPLLRRYRDGDLQIIARLEQVLDERNVVASTIDADCIRLGNYLRGNRAAQLRQIRTDVAHDIAKMAEFRMRFSLDQWIQGFDESEALVVRLDALPADAIAARTTLREQIWQMRARLFEHVQRMQASIEEINHWLPHVRGPRRSAIVEAADGINRGYPALELAHMKITELMNLVTHRNPADDVSWRYLQNTLLRAEDELCKALYLQAHLLEAGPGPTQRNRILHFCLETFDTYLRQLHSWVASAPEHVDNTYVALMRNEIHGLRARAEKSLTAQSTPAAKNTNKQVFETDKNVLLIGEKRTSTNASAQQYTMTGPRGVEQIWEQGRDGKFRLTNPPTANTWQPIARDLRPLLNEARRRLAGTAAHRAKVEGYAQQNMSPSDLEFMMTSEAEKLNQLARHIQDLDAQADVIVTLQRKADELIELGQQLRIQQTLGSRTPTEGYLDYLMGHTLNDQPIVDIRKIGLLEALGRRQDGRADFMQEYEIRDLRGATPQVLWYAHFHYESATPQSFDSFAKAHLKLPEQRRLGLKWQQNQAQGRSEGDVTAIWRGNIEKPIAKRHFQNL